MAKITGTKKNDVLKGTAGDDKIIGLGGDDTIITKGGADIVDAGSGNDTLTISNGSSATVNMGGGRDTVNIKAGAESSTIKLGGGNDTVNINVSKLENQTFEINGGGGKDTIAFKGGIELYDVTDDGKVRTVADAHGNTYILSTGDKLTFAGVTYVAPVTPPNRAPEAANPIGSQAVSQDQTLNFQFAANTFTDADGDALTYTVSGVDGSALPSWLVFDGATRTFSGTPTNGDVGIFSVVVTASDGNATATSTFELTVNNVNDAPTGTATAVLTGAEDTPFIVTAETLLQGFSDADGDAMSVTGLTASNGATVTNNGNDTWTITPTANFNGPVSLSYTVSDGNGGSTNATQSVAFAAVNDAPTGAATAVLAAGAEDIAYTVTAEALLQGFSDVDNDALSVTGLIASNGATVTNNGNGTWTITPAANFNGSIGLSYTVTDGHGGSIGAAQSLTFTAVNDAPTGPLTGALAAGTEDTPYIVTAQTLLQGFSDAEGDAMSITGLTASGGASVTNHGNGTWTVTPNANFNGSINLSYTVTDGHGGSTSASRSLEFDAVNDAPFVAHSIADQTATEGQSFSFQFASNTFSDVDNAVLTYTAKLADNSDLPSWLHFNATTRTFSGTPGADDDGTIAVRVTASDGSLSTSDVFTLKVNDVPTVVSGVLMLNADTDYEVSEALGKIYVTVDGNTFEYNSADITDVNTLGANKVDIDTGGWSPRDIDGDVNFSHVTFTVAGPSAVKFESSFELGGFEITGKATVNDNPADFFRAAWAYIDDHYYYNNYAVNSYAVDIGIKYVEYLNNGGATLTDIVKYEADNNSNGIPQRSQMMHDNLIGNLNEYGIVDKFSGGSGEYAADAVIQRIIDAGLDDFIGDKGVYTDGRQWIGGYESEINSPTYGSALAFDYAHKFDRPDYVSFTSSGTVDIRATEDGLGAQMYFGSGNLPSGYVISQHEGAGIETALKVHVRGGADYTSSGSFTGDSAETVVVFQVDSGGASPTSWTPAKWNFDYSIVTGLNGTLTDLDDFDFELKIDTDRSDVVNYMVFKLEGSNGTTQFVARDDNDNIIGVSGEDPSSGDGVIDYLAQDSINFGFDFLKDSIDGGYDFGLGKFDIELLAYKHGTHHVLSSVHIQIQVPELI